jgi:microcystin-dependent protein
MVARTLAELLSEMQGDIARLKRRRTPGAVTPLLGEVRIIAGDTPPSSWIIADGRAVSRAQWPRLFERIGTTFGAGDGSTTFNVPHLRPPVLQGPPRPVTFIIYAGRFAP